MIRTKRRNERSSQWFTFSSKIFKIKIRKKPEALRTSYYQTFSCFPETNQFAVPWKARRKIEFSDVDWIIKWISSKKNMPFLYFVTKWKSVGWLIIIVLFFKERSCKVLMIHCRGVGRKIGHSSFPWRSIWI